MSTEWFDPVVEEVRQRGQACMERFGHDIDAIMEDLRKHQREHPERYVSQITITRPEDKKKDDMPGES